MYIEDYAKEIEVLETMRVSFFYRNNSGIGYGVLYKGAYKIVNGNIWFRFLGAEAAYPLRNLQKNTII